MDKSKDVILVTGATGKQGGAVAHELIRKGYKVRAMTRQPDSPNARELANAGAEVIRGDLDDERSVAKALERTWGAFAVQNTWEAGVEREEEQGKRFAKLAKAAGIHHIVYSSVASAHRQTGIPHFENKWRVEETKRGLGFPSYTIIRPVFFMENFLGPGFLPAIQQGRLEAAMKPETALQMIAVRDIGKHGARAFEKHEELNGKSYDLAGDSLTMPQVAEVLSQVIGHEVRFTPSRIEDVRKFSEDYAIMLEWFDRVGYDVDIARLEKETGITGTRFREWARQADWAHQTAAR
jgi:uncharacterized protein YbjT (DUF2867 family)